MIGEARERLRQGAAARERPAGRGRALVTVLDEAAQVDYVCGEVLAAREAGVALKAQAVLFRTAHHCGPLEVELVRRNIPFVKFGGLKFLDAAHVKDLLACLRLAREPARPAGRVPRAAADAGRRRRRRPRRCWRRSRPATAALRRAEARRRRTGRACRALRAACAAARPAGRPSSRRRGPGTSRISSACTRTPRSAAATSCSSCRIAAGFASRRALPDRAHPRPAAGDERPGRGAASRRGLSRSSRRSTRPRGRSGSRSSC